MTAVLITPLHSILDTDMVDSTRSYLDALLDLSGDPGRADSRNSLIKGLDDATLRDFIGECLNLNTSRVVREHIVKYLLDDIAVHGTLAAPQGSGYVDALCVLSGNSAHTGALHDLTKKAPDSTLHELIRDCPDRGTSRAVQERALNSLVDAITEQARSRAQPIIKEEEVEELLINVAEEEKSRGQHSQKTVEDGDEVRTPGRKRKRRVQKDDARTDVPSKSKTKMFKRDSEPMNSAIHEGDTAGQEDPPLAHQVSASQLTGMATCNHLDC